MVDITFDFSITWLATVFFVLVGLCIGLCIGCFEFSYRKSQLQRDFDYRVEQERLKYAQKEVAVDNSVERVLRRHQFKVVEAAPADRVDAEAQLIDEHLGTYDLSRRR